MYYQNPFSEDDLKEYRRTLPKQYPEHKRKKGYAIGEYASRRLDELLAAMGAGADGKRNPKTHQKELIQDYLANGGTPGRYGENIPDDPRTLKGDDDV